MKSNQKIINSSINIPVVSSDYTISLIGSAPNYTGHGSPLSNSSQIGINLSGEDNYHINNLQFTNINGTAVNVENTSGGWKHFGHISHVGVKHSYFGFRFHNSAEYQTVSDCNASNCVFGYVVESGNNSFSNCKATFCSVAVKITGGTNNAHGVWNGLISNHNTYNLVCVDVTLGEHFHNCCFIAGQSGSNQGKIQIINSKGITINGGQIAFIDMTIDANSQVDLSNICFRGNVNISLSAGGVLTAKNNVLTDANLKLNGVSWDGNL